MNIILTGVTGTLGSQVFIELLQNQSIKKIHLLIRDQKKSNAKKRFLNIINSTDFLNSDKTAEIEEKVRIHNALEFLKPENYILAAEKNYFIHSAGLVNLSTDKTQREAIFNENLEFTKTLFKTFTNFIDKFTYISTAFAIGNTGGVLENDYHKNQTPNYRNAYEESKHLTEKHLLKHGKLNNVVIQILRPSVLGGNIYSTPKYFVSKYMVYYLLGKFFYKNPLTETSSIRISANLKTGLNIIPTDYVAKVIAKVFEMDITQLNIVHNKSTNFLTGISKILNQVDFKNYTIVDNIASKDLKDKNRIETFYYATIGNHLASYFLSKPYEFDTTILEKIVPMPTYNLEDYLGETLKYAMEHNFKDQNW